MYLLLSRASWRFYRRHPWQLVLALAGIALGIAVFVGVELANDSAARAFGLTTGQLRGSTTHRLLPVGALLSENIYRDLRLAGTAAQARPVLEANVRVNLPDGRGRRMTLIGLDPVAELGMGRDALLLPGRNSDIAALIVEPDTVLLPGSLTAELDPDADGRIDLVVDGRRRSVHVVGTTQTAQPDGGGAALIADLSTAQELTGSLGQLSRIDLSLDASAARELAAATPPGTVLVAAGSENDALEQLTDAFATNLTALGLLALVVGMFLIYATISFAIVQRRRSFAFLRSIGLARRELMGALLGEALAIGCVGTLLGLALGHFLATGLIDLVLRTLDDLYFRRAVAAVAPSPWIFVQGLLLGIGATLISALVPALEAARRDPAVAENRSALERGSRRLSRRAAWASLPVFGLAVVALLLDAQSLLLAFTSLFFVLIGGALLIPLGTTWLMGILERPVGALGSLPGLLAVRGVTQSLSRTGVATAALAVAVATVMSIGLMIGSFRTSLVAWLDSTLTADIYLSLDSDGAAAATLARAIGEIEADPAVRGLSLTQFARLPSQWGEIGMRAVTAGPEGLGLDLREPANGNPEALLAAEDTVLLAEPFAYRYELGVGDDIELPTAHGSRHFAVGGVFRDYNSAGAALVISLDAYRRYWSDEGLSGIGVHLVDGVNSAVIAARLRAMVAAEGLRVDARSTDSIERLSLVIFDRTFQVTEVLRLLAGLVAFLGVLSAILAIQLERERDYAILRSIGMSARELGTQILTQTGLLGVAAGIAAVPIGTVLAWLLVYVINRRSFGWSMDLSLSLDPLLQGFGLAIAAALLAGIYPAYLGAKLGAGAAWRDE